MISVQSILAKPAKKLTLESRSIKAISLVGQHLVERCGTAHDIEREILDAYRGANKLMIIQLIHIKKLKPQLNTRDEYRGIDIGVLNEMQ